MTDILVIGGGPAGVSAALYAARAGKTVELVYRASGSLGKAEHIDNFYGFPGGITGQELFSRGLEQAAALGVTVTEAEVTGFGFEAAFTVTTTAGKKEAKAVVLATGSSRKAPAIPGLAELEGRGVSYCALCDGFFCRGKAVAVLGSGSYALQEAEDLKEIAASVTLLTNGEPLPPDMPSWLKYDTRTVKALTGEPLLQAAAFDEGEDLPVARVFVALGTADTGALAKKIGVITENGKIAVNSDMSTNVPGLFAAGDCTGGLAQVAKAVYEGSVAGINAAKYLKK